ncbi:hypothetical protein JVU11DRAFT_5878 [Chiua virens]|nr:hypothetical protein JVU11DRAFT_5878 [Chiua virens]
MCQFSMSLTPPIQSTATPTTLRQVKTFSPSLRLSGSDKPNSATSLQNSPQVESIMQRVREVHQQLLDKRDQIRASMEAHRGLISCIRRLPPELLAKIFGVAQGGAGNAKAYGVRYRACPLSLAVDARQSPRNPVWRYEVTELLQPYTSRSVRLHIMFDEATAPDLLLKDVPILEHLTLDGDLRIAQKISIVQPQPQLRSLTVNAVTLTSEVLSAFNPNWSNLTRLRVKLNQTPEHEADRPIVLTLLALCPHLESFSFSPVYISRHDVPQRRPLMHAKLRSLEVVVVYGVGSFLDSVTLPDLRHLVIRDLDIIPSAWRQNEFKTFLSSLRSVRSRGSKFMGRRCRLPRRIDKSTRR